MIKTLAILIFTLTIAGNAISAPDLPGKNWEYLCNNGGSGATICGMYLKGFIEGSSTQADVKNSPKMFCIPENISIKDIQKDFGEYLSKHPERWAESIGTLAAISLVEKFPCR